MNKKAHQWLGIFKSIGPGLLFAGAAIGASHLVQSTRAGANYGYRLIGLIILVLALKYPFFEYAHRYTAATGKTILKGYLNLGRWALAIFFVLALCAAFINTAAVTLVTACLGGFLFGIDISPALLSIPVIIVVAVILLLGRYPLLDKAMKIMLSLLAIATLVAVSAALVKGNPALSGSVHPKLWNLAGVTFLLALMGWMPTPLDISVWPSLWRIERKKQTRYTPSMKEVLFDFNFGYILTGILAIAFLLLGALVMYGSGQTFSNSGIQFSEQLISLYTKQ